MILSFDKIKEITFGAVRFFEEDGFLYPKRCTEYQEQLWEKYIPDSGKYSKMTTGIRLDFHTNSNALRFVYLAKDTRAYSHSVGYTYDLLINGVLVTTLSGISGDGILEAALPDGENRVTVVFPIGATGAIKELSLDDGATCTPHKYDKKFMFFGDSITQGFSSEYSHLTYAYQVAEFFNADLLNQGVGCGDFLPRTVDESIEYSPDAVFIAFGTNDWSHFPTLERLRERCSDFLDVITKKYAGKKVFCLTPLWRADEKAGRAMGTFAQCREVIRREIASHGFTVIEGCPLVPNTPEFFFDKALHPSTLGFTLYAKNLIKEVQKYL